MRVVMSMVVVVVMIVVMPGMIVVVPGMIVVGVVMTAFARLVLVKLLP